MPANMYRNLSLHSISPADKGLEEALILIMQSGIPKVIACLNFIHPQSKLYCLHISHKVDLLNLVEFLNFTLSLLFKMEESILSAWCQRLRHWLSDTGILLVLLGCYYSQNMGTSYQHWWWLGLLHPWPGHYISSASVNSLRRRKHPHMASCKAPHHSYRHQETSYFQVFTV